MKSQEFDLAQGEEISFETSFGSVSVFIVDIDEETDSITFGIDSPQDFKVVLGDRTREVWGTPRCKGIPRIWLLFSLILSHRVRRDIFMPTFNEFVEDYSFAKQRIRKPWEKRWIACAFTIRTISMILSCAKIQLSMQATGLLDILGKFTTYWR